MGLLENQTIRRVYANIDIVSYIVKYSFLLSEADANQRKVWTFWTLDIQ